MCDLAKKFYISRNLSRAVGSRLKKTLTAPKIHEDALQIIKDVAGTQLDAELVKYFLIIPKERLFQCTPEQVKY